MNDDTVLNAAKTLLLRMSVLETNSSNNISVASPKPFFEV